MIDCEEVVVLVVSMFGMSSVCMRHKGVCLGRLLFLSTATSLVYCVYGWPGKVYQPENCFNTAGQTCWKVPWPEPWSRWYHRDQAAPLLGGTCLCTAEFITCLIVKISVVNVLSVRKLKAVNPINGLGMYMKNYCLGLSHHNITGKVCSPNPSPKVCSPNPSPGTNTLKQEGQGNAATPFLTKAVQKL